MKKQTPKKPARRRKNPATALPHFPDFLKSLVQAITKTKPPEFAMYTYDDMLSMSAGFANSLMRMAAEELDEFNQERYKLLSEEILDLCRHKYDLGCHEAGVLLFHLGTTMMSAINDEFNKGGGNVPGVHS